MALSGTPSYQRECLINNIIIKKKPLKDGLQPQKKSITIMKMKKMTK